MENIRLNFCALANQDITFKVYRSLVDNGSLTKIDDDYRTKLPSKDDEWPLYDISLKPKAGYESFEYHYSINPSFSEDFLFKLLMEKISSDWKECKYLFPENSKYKEIRFITASQKKGCTQIIVHPYYLKTERKLGFLFQHHFALSADEKFDRQTQILSYSLDNSGRPNVFIYRDKEAVIQEFITKKFEPFLNNNSLQIEGSFLNLPAKELAQKSYKVGKNQQSQSQFIGIKNSGPFLPVIESVQYLFLFSEKTRSLARDVYLGLTGKLFPGQFSGLFDLFSLPINKEIVNHHVIEVFDQKHLDDFGVQIDELKRQHSESKIMLIAILPKGFKGVEGIFDAYGYLKLLALKHGIYCQFVTEDTFFKKDQLKWSISNIALQIFSKLGGKPWLVKPAKNNCLILGLGSAHEEVEGEIKKFVAYTVCLDSSGDFKYIKPLSSSRDQNEYIRNLALSLEEILRAELDAHYTSFVLHLPSKIKREEIDAIKDVVKKIRNDNSCEVIVVKINTRHRFYGFGNHNTRVPYESSLIQLSQNQFLLWAEGRQHGKEVLHRVSEPLLIDFLEPPKSSESKFECLQDILNLTGANWRGFNSKAQPISILYSKLIADFMKEFSHLDECKDFSVLRAVSVAPWFL